MKTINLIQKFNFIDYWFQLEKEFQLPEKV